MQSESIENLNLHSVKKTFKRLKRGTKSFSGFIVRDPLDFLDFEVNLENNIKELILNINKYNYHPAKPYLHLSAKSKGINRPTVIFDVQDALVYRFCVEQIEKELFKQTRNNRNIRGGIMITANKNEEGDDYYEKWFNDWKDHQKSLENILNYKQYLVITDIASYFENINILLLKDLIRTDIDGKQGILNLLFYFLENCRFRFCYEVNTFNGLPQEDIDCSRVLAYYFLGNHDVEMARFCRNNDADFFRFVDDMSIALNDEVTGKKALRYLTESLRRLNLVSSIEKTSILRKDEAKRELFFEENEVLTKIEENILDKILKKQQPDNEENQLIEFYKECINLNKHKLKNWVKVLRRFYSLFSYIESDYFLSNIANDLINIPTLFSKNKLAKYLISNKEFNIDKLKICIIDLINYLYSEDNLYPALESNILESLLYFTLDDFDIELNYKVKELAINLFFKNKIKPLSDYARALACLLVYRFSDKDDVEKIANHYLKYTESDYMLKKHIIFITLTLENDDLRKKIIKKATNEQNISINRLINFIENMNQYKDYSLVKNYINNNKLYIYYDKYNGLEIVKNYLPIRAEILKKLIDIYK
ncbi:MAG: hypothetical protein GF365_01455 [Candidatus Buchananbacteria bacterium]|nr:hypothetical protein [Candidatus Buchananbacteria bacterium]